MDGCYGLSLQIHRIPYIRPPKRSMKHAAVLSTWLKMTPSFSRKYCSLHSQKATGYISMKKCPQLSTFSEVEEIRNSRANASLSLQHVGVQERNQEVCPQCAGALICTSVCRSPCISPTTTAVAAFHCRFPFPAYPNQPNMTQ